MHKRITTIALSLVLAVTMLLQAIPATGQVGQAALAGCKEFAFSTEEDFVTHGPEPPDGNPIISDGDLLGLVTDVSGGVGCRVCARNRDLLSAFNLQLRADLGLDAADVIDVEGYLVAFSTELDSPPLGQFQFTAGDLLVTNGVIIPNIALTDPFTVTYDIGLDAVHFVGDVEAIIAFLDQLRQGEVPPPGQFAGMLADFDIDIWFSTEGTFTPDPLKPPVFLDGDLLSARFGTIVASNDVLLPPSVPAGIPERGVDFGLDAATTNRVGSRERIHFSTEILFDGEPTFTDGDVLRFGNGVAAKNDDLIGCFEPMVKELGLDALSVSMPVTRPCESRITKIAGVDLADIGGDGMALTGTVGSITASVPFGGWIDIQGSICDDVQEYRVAYRRAGTVSPWTGMDVLPALNWTVKDDAFIPPWPDCLGTMGWMSDADGWYDGANYRQLTYPSLGGCNSGLALTVWDSSHINVGLGGPDALYEVVLAVKTATGIVSGTVHLVQLDNTPPVAELEKVAGICNAYDDGDMPLMVTGRFSDTHFYRYRLRITGDGYGWYPYSPVAYYDDALDNVIDIGTVNWANYVDLHGVDVHDLAANPVPCGYTVDLRAWERTLWCTFNFPNNQAHHYPGHRHDDDAWTFDYTPGP